MAPEAYLGQRFDYCNDMWALGICMYELATNKHPFAPFHSYQWRGRLLKASYDREPLERLDPLLKKLIIDLIQLDANKRPNAE